MTFTVQNSTAIQHGNAFNFTAIMNRPGGWNCQIAQAVFAMLSFAIIVPTGFAKEPQAKLPGARSTVHAIQHDSLQAALDAVPAEGGLVVLPAGTFELTEPLRVEKGDICIQGSGTATHLVNRNSDGKPAILIANPKLKNPSGRERNTLWRIRLADLRITGNEQSGAGIEARQVNEIHVDGVSVSENGREGILLNYCYEDPRITDCLITYNKGTGVSLPGCHDIVVSGCQFEENNDALRCEDAYNLCMTGCCVDDHLRHGVVIENTYGSVLSGNMIEECNGTAVILDRDCYGITLSANVIAHNGAGIDLRDAHGCAVSANTLTILKTDAVRIGPDSGRITVTGNNFSNSYIGEDKVRRAEGDLAAAGLVLESTNDVTVSGNVFSGLTDKAIRVEGTSKRVVVANNVFSDVKSEHVKLADSVVVDNKLSVGSSEDDED